MTATTANAPPHRAAYADWSPSDKMEPGDSFRLSIALYHGLSTANFDRQIRYGKKFTKRRGMDELVQGATRLDIRLERKRDSGHAAAHQKLLLI
jgi:hypothetical protein